MLILLNPILYFIFVLYYAWPLIMDGFMASNDLLRELTESLEALQQRRQENRLQHYRPYAKQAEFHRLGASRRERLLCAGNQQIREWS